MHSACFDRSACCAGVLACVRTVARFHAALQGQFPRELYTEALFLWAHKTVAGANCLSRGLRLV